MATPNFAHNQAAFEVTVGGVNVTEKVNPYLIALDVKLSAAHSDDSATIELDDTGGQLEIPQPSSTVTISLGWVGWGASPVFSGFVKETQSMGSRSAGRTLVVQCTGTDFTGKAKEPHQAHADKVDFAGAAAKFAKLGGLTAAVSSSVGKVARDWWGMNSESFVHWGQRMAGELGATFRIQGSTAAFVPRGGGSSASGGSITGTVADFSGPQTNGISWDIIPKVGRPGHASVTAKFFDMVEAKWKSAVKATGIALPAKALGLNLAPAADKDSAEAAAQSAATDSIMGTGRGTVVVVGDPDAQVAGACEVKGARDGVDGSYQIDWIEHRYRRTEGFITSIGLVQSGDAFDAGAGGGSGEGAPAPPEAGSVTIPTVPGFPG